MLSICIKRTKAFRELKYWNIHICTSKVSWKKKTFWQYKKKQPIVIWHAKNQLFQFILPLDVPLHVKMFHPTLQLSLLFKSAERVKRISLNSGNFGIDMICYTFDRLYILFLKLKRKQNKFTTTSCKVDLRWILPILFRSVWSFSSSTFLISILHWLQVFEFKHSC